MQPLDADVVQEEAHAPERGYPLGPVQISFCSREFVNLATKSGSGDPSARLMIDASAAEQAIDTAFDEAQCIVVKTRDTASIGRLEPPIEDIDRLMHRAADQAGEPVSEQGALAKPCRTLEGHDPCFGIGPGSIEPPGALRAAMDLEAAHNGQVL